MSSIQRKGSVTEHRQRAGARPATRVGGSERITGKTGPSGVRIQGADRVQRVNRDGGKGKG